MERVCIAGLGAVGGLLGARLAAVGIEVSALARGETLEAVRRRGLELRRPGEAEGTAYPVTAESDPTRLPTPDLVVLSVKAPALPAVAPAVAALLGPETVLLSATNGLPWWFFHGLAEAGGIELPVLDPDGSLHRLLPPERVVGGVLHFTASRPEPGVVAHGAGERIIVGSPGPSVERGGPPGPIVSEPGDPRAEQVAALLRRAGFEVPVSERIQRDIWFKLWGNMTMNPISALTGATTDRVLDDDLARAFVSRCMREAAAVGERIGLPIDITPEERHQVTRKLGAMRTSMLQDVEAHRPVELDALLTCVTDLGRAVDVPTPDLDTLLGLARLQARTRGLYPS